MFKASAGLGNNFCVKNGGQGRVVLILLSMPSTVPLPYGYPSDLQAVMFGPALAACRLCRHKCRAPFHPQSSPSGDTPPALTHPLLRADIYLMERVLPAHRAYFLQQVNPVVVERANQHLEAIYGPQPTRFVAWHWR